MSYQRRILATGTVFKPETNGTWSLADFNGDGSPDLVFIKTTNTGTNSIEVHASRNESRFQEHSLATGTVFSGDDHANGIFVMRDYTGDGKADLVFIKTRNTGTNTVELHVADAASGYRNFVQQTGTCFGANEHGTGVWDLTSRGDLILIKTSGCQSGKVEIHVASKSSNFQQFNQHVATDFDLEDNGTWCIDPKSTGEFPDLYYIKTRNTGTRMVEIHAVSAASGWKSRTLATGTSFAPEDNGHWFVSHFSHQAQPDLVYIKTSDCGSNSVEIHVVEPKVVVPASYTQSSRNVRLEGANFVGELQRNDGSWRSASIDLDLLLGNDGGRLSWDKQAFSKNAKNVRLEGSTIRAQLEKSEQDWQQTDFDLAEKLFNNDGVFQAVQVPVIIAVAPELEKEFMTELDSALSSPDFKIQAVKEQDGSTTFYANAGVSSEGTVFRTYTAEARASVMHLVKSNGRPIEQVNVDVFTAGASATVGTYTGVEAGVSLFKAQASLFDLNLGAGIDTGLGIKDESLDLKLAGCGIQIGRKVSISAFGSSFGIDFGRLFG